MNKNHSSEHKKERILNATSRIRSTGEVHGTLSKPHRAVHYYTTL